MPKEHPFLSFFSLKNLWRKFKKNESDSNLRETIEELIEVSRETEHSIESDERQLLGNVLNLRDSTAYDVMLPRADIIAAPFSVNDQEIIQQFVKTKVTHILIYKHNLDHVIGMIHLKDIVSWQNGNNPWVLKNLLREVLFISPTMRTLDLLLKMRETGCKIAVVVDEYGGVDGLVTFSNLIEEVVGDIQNANTQFPPAQIEKLADGSVIADARITLEEFNDTFEKPLVLKGHNDDIDTLGGLVVFLAGRVPVKGEIISHSAGIEFEVLDADPRKVRRLRIRKVN